MRFKTLACSTLLLLCATAAIYVPPVECQDTKPVVNEPKAGQNVLDLSAEQFEAWLKNLSHLSGEKKVQPTELEAALIKRIESKKPLTSTSTYIVVHAWNVYEEEREVAPKRAPDPHKTTRHNDSLRVIERLAGLYRGQREMLATLYDWQIILSRATDQDVKAVEAYQKWLGSTRVSPVTMDLDRFYVDAALHWGQIFHHTLGDTKRAEQLYYAVLRYPVNKFESDAAFKSYTGTYILAGQELIDLRTGDLKALQNTYFYHMGKAKLLRPLSTAIEEAGGDSKDVERMNFYLPGLEEAMRAEGEWPRNAVRGGEDIKQ